MQSPRRSLVVVTLLLGFLSSCPGSALSLQSLYSQARQVRALEGHDRALPLYRDIVKNNPSDVTAATRIAADQNSQNRHDDFGRGGDRIQKLRFVELLKGFGFDRDPIAGLVLGSDPKQAAFAKRSSAPLYLQPLRAGTTSPFVPNCPLGACIQLLLLAVCLPRKTCVDLLGSEFVQLIETLGLAYTTTVSHNNNNNNSNDDDEEETLLVPYVHVFPVTICDETIFLATDLHPNVLSLTTVGSVSRSDGTVKENGSVMYIGPDSLALLDHWSCLQNLKDTDSIVDIGCGSGIQALGLAVRSSGKAKVTCVDINERALRFTRFNFECNGFEEPTLIQGDINSPVGSFFETEFAPKPWKELLGESTTTYLVSNPPFLPVPVHDPTISSRYGLFSSGGSTGEEFLQSLIRLSSSLLDRQNPSATLAIVSEFMNPSVDFGLRLSSWWNDVGPAQALLLTNEEALDADLYAQRRADGLEEASIWKEHLRQEGIQCVSPGLMFLKRAPTTRGNQPRNEIKKTNRDAYPVDLTHFLVPKTSEGSCWTPTNLDARKFTRNQIENFSLP